MHVITPGSHGQAIRDLQIALNKRSRSRGLPLIKVDGDYGAETAKAVSRVARALGALEATIARPGISVGEQRMILWPLTRSPAQYARARGRAKRAPVVTGRGPRAALAWASLWIGKTEEPPGSNRASWGLTSWQQDLGAWLVGQAWCGTFVGTALKRAGVAGITSRVAGVVLILEDARLGRNGFRSIVYRRSTGQGSVTAGQPGDAIGLFGESTHVGLIERRVPGGWATIEGNTSSSSSGSQSNGGGCFRRTRPDSAVVYIVRPSYPEV
jgi:peptidoglycan hydrolase-like protein with peptidoglycan-binding domain